MKYFRALEDRVNTACYPYTSHRASIFCHDDVHRHRGPHMQPWRFSLKTITAHEDVPTWGKSIVNGRGTVQQSSLQKEGSRGRPSLVTSAATVDKATITSMSNTKMNHVWLSQLFDSFNVIQRCHICCPGLVGDMVDLINFLLAQQYVPQPRYIRPLYIVMATLETIITVFTCLLCKQWGVR